MMVNQSSHSPLTKSILNKIYHGKLIRKDLKLSAGVRHEVRAPNPINYHLSHDGTPIGGAISISNHKKFTLIGNVYQKTVPENQLEVNLENECELFKEG